MLEYLRISAGNVNVSCGMRRPEAPAVQLYLGADRTEDCYLSICTYANLVERTFQMIGGGGIYVLAIDQKGSRVAFGENKVILIDATEQVVIAESELLGPISQLLFVSRSTAVASAMNVVFGLELPTLRQRWYREFDGVSVDMKIAHNGLLVVDGLGVTWICDVSSGAVRYATGSKGGGVEENK